MKGKFYISVLFLCAWIVEMNYYLQEFRTTCNNLSVNGVK